MHDVTSMNVKTYSRSNVKGIAVTVRGLCGLVQTKGGQTIVLRASIGFKRGD